MIFVFLYFEFTFQKVKGDAFKEAFKTLLF